MSLILYYGPGACSFVPHTLLQASGAEFDARMVKLHKGEQREAAFQALNPRGQVPVLVDGETAISQIMAICLHLEERFPQAGFLPAKGVARAKVLEMFAWMNNTVHPTFTHVFRPAYFSEDEQAQVGIKQLAITNFRKHLAQLQTYVQALGDAGQAWLSGAHFGPLDAYALTLARWGTIAGITPEEHPALWRFVERVAAHPPVQQVIERERLVLNTAAA
jgi:glutathione S-transferase